MLRMILIQTICCIAVLILMGREARANPVSCRDTSDTPLLVATALYELYYESEYMNFSMNIVPCLQGQLSNLNILRTNQDIPRRCGDEARQHSGDMNCDVPQHGGLISNFADELHGATCRWSYEMDMDELRIPKHIAKAMCSCIHCHRGICMPVNSYVPVLRKECNVLTGRFEYRKYIQEVPVGCACVRSQVSSRSNTQRRLVMHE